MTFEYPCGRKLTQLVSHHVFGDKNLVKHLAVVDHKRKANELRDYRTSSRPGLDRLARADGVLPVDLGKQLLINERSFFQRSSHFSYLVSLSLDASTQMRGEITWLIVFVVYSCAFE